MKKENKSNFTFVREIYPELYSDLLYAESHAYLDIIDSGNKLRKVLETLAINLVKEYDVSIQNQNSKGPSLADRVYALNKANKLSDKKYSFVQIDGKKNKHYGFWIWRQFGNVCHHSPDEWESWQPKPTFSNLIVVFNVAHSFFKSEYARKLGKMKADDIRNFNKDIMPVGDHYVLRSAVPMDSSVTNCVREIETISYTESGRIAKYGIVRIFAKSNIDEKILTLRDTEAFNEAESEAGIQFDGNVQVEVLSKMTSENSEFYVIIYKFSQEPNRLTDQFLAGLTVRERVDLCHRICRIIYHFHHLSTPIYHRNISFDCVYVCKNKLGEYEPSIIKLDCAKIDSKEFGTTISKLQDVREKIKQNQYLKYASPEVNINLHNDGAVAIDWEKADIYSLGVLFSDILSGQINNNIVRSTKLQRQIMNMPLIQLIDKMRHPRSELRPTIDIVVQSFEEMD